MMKLPHWRATSPLYVVTATYSETTETHAGRPVMPGGIKSDRITRKYQQTVLKICFDKALKVGGKCKQLGEHVSPISAPLHYDQIKKRKPMYI